MRYVGHIDVGIVKTRHNDRREFGMDVPVAFFMNDRDERRVKIMSDDKQIVEFIKEFNGHWPEAMLWQRGGPFPKGFKPNENVLGEMLSRMIDARLLGKEPT